MGVRGRACEKRERESEIRAGVCVRERECEWEGEIRAGERETEGGREE